MPNPRRCATAPHLPELRMSRRERQKRRRSHRGHPVRRSALLTVTLVISGVVIAALAGVGWVVAVADTAPNLKTLKPHAPNPPSAIYASDGTLLGYIHSSTIANPTKGTQIPQLLKDATVAIEDRRFFHHGALDYQGIVRAGIRDVFGGHNSLQGASTLTMQLVDNDYLPSSIGANHNLKYKIVQAKLAQQLESEHSKNWILDTYLNDVPYGTVGGTTAIGVGAAAEMFFNKSVEQLEPGPGGASRRASPGSVGLQPVPARRTSRSSAAARCSRRWCLSHYITQAQANRAARAPLQVQTTNKYNTRQQPYVFDYVQQQLIDKLGLRTVQNGGLKVYTTINLKMQGQAQRAIDANQPGGANLDAQPAAALATVDPSQRAHPGAGAVGHLRPDQVRLPGAGRAADRIGVQGVRADDADPRLPRRPQPDLLHLAVPPRGLASLRSDLVGAHGRGQLRGDDQPQPRHGRLRQHRVRPARRRPRLGQARPDRPRDGHHLEAHRQPVRGDRRPERTAARCWRWPTRTPRWPTAGSTTRPRSSTTSCSRTAASRTSATRPRTACSPTARPTRPPRSSRA